MRYKRNIFLSLLALAYVYSCQMENKPAPAPAPPLMFIADGKAVLGDSTFIEIPHWGDTAYTIFYCVRHAEKRKDQGDNPELTPEGEARTERLGVILSNEPLDKVFSTNYKRTVLTAEAVRKKAVTPSPGETYPPAMQDVWLDETLKQGTGKRYLVVGHSNTIPQLLNRLKGTNEFQNIPEDDYGRFYVAVTKGIGQTEVLEFRY